MVVESLPLEVNQTEEKASTSFNIKQFLNKIMPTSGATKEIAALDGLRALAILMVIWCHLYFFASTSGYKVNLGPQILQRAASFGYSGVFLFFCLSGFLLFLPYARSILYGRDLPSMRKFYWRRMLRILPLFYAAVAVLVLFGNNNVISSGNWQAIVLTLLMIHDVSWTSFNAISSPFWTLAIEWQFYLILPFIALALTKFAGSNNSRWFAARIIIFLASLVTLGLVIRFVASSIYFNHGVEPVNMHGWAQWIAGIFYGVKGKYVEIFTLGISSSFLYVKFIEQKGLSAKYQWVLGTVALILFAVCILLCFKWSFHDDRQWVWASRMRWTVLGEWALGVSFNFLLLGVLFGPKFVKRFFASVPLKFIGIISYSIYVWHFSIIQSFTQVALSGHFGLGYLRLAVFSCIVVFIFCTCSYYLIEHPFIKYRKAAHSAVELKAAAA